jgi:hypothetical protein
MESSREALEREIKELEAERQPIAEEHDRSGAKLARIDTEIQRRKAALAPFLEDLPVEQSTSPPAKKVEVEVAIGKLLERHGDMEKAELTQRLMDGETGEKYTKKNVGISLGVLTRSQSDKLTRKITHDSKGKIKSEIIGFGPKWPKKG